MVAYTDAAGKFSVDAPRNGNEDNFFFAYDLSKDAPSKGEPDVDTQMSECGLLMVVADGMGGMNAGEVASQIAVDTVAEFFAPGKITPEFAKDHQKRKKYMEHVISEADIRIKKDSKHDSEHKGMGSTIIMAWIVGDELTLSWCGDSRAYRYNPACGIEPLSRDHSYVQELADKGIIKYEDTFDHPQGNIVTRSLGDVSKKAIPETELFKVYNDDIILLCSDGLSGVLRDKKTYDMDGELIDGENLEDIISANRETLKGCREALWKAAEKADWYDNVTAVLCEIRSGAGIYVPIKKEETSSNIKSANENINKTFKGINIRLSTRNILLSLIGLLLIIGVTFFAAWKLFSNKQDIDSEQVSKADSIASKKSETLKEKNVTQDLNFVKTQTELKLKLKEIQNKLGVSSNIIYINQLSNKLEAAKDTSELSTLKNELLLLEQKVPYLKKIILEKAKNASNHSVTKELDAIFDKIILSRNIKGEEWGRKINKITEVKTRTHSETGKTEDPSEITEIISDDYQQPYEITIRSGDSFRGIVNFMEKTKFPGYYVSLIMDAETGEIYFDRSERPAVLISINTVINRRAKIILLKK
jgi:serine/threonine protein phosphatase PrpC